MMKLRWLTFLCFPALLSAGELLAPLAVDDRGADTAPQADAESLIREERPVSPRLEIPRTNRLDAHWFTQSRPGGYFSSEAVKQPVLLFDLGRDRTLSAVLIWNYALASSGVAKANATRSLTFAFNTEAQGTDTFEGPSLPMELAAPGEEGASATISPETLTLEQPVRARYLRLQINSNYATAGGDGGDRVGLSRLRVQVED